MCCYYVQSEKLVADPDEHTSELNAIRPSQDGMGESTHHIFLLMRQRRVLMR